MMCNDAAGQCSPSMVLGSAVPCLSCRCRCTARRYIALVVADVHVAFTQLLRLRTPKLRLAYHSKVGSDRSDLEGQSDMTTRDNKPLISPSPLPSKVILAIGSQKNTIVVVLSSLTARYYYNLSIVIPFHLLVRRVPVHTGPGSRVPYFSWFFRNSGLDNQPTAADASGRWAVTRRWPDTTATTRIDMKSQI